MTDQQIEAGLRAMIKFPETIQEVEQFEKVFGNVDINLSVEEWDMMFEKIMERLNKHK